MKKNENLFVFVKNNLIWLTLLSSNYYVYFNYKSGPLIKSMKLFKNNNSLLLKQILGARGNVLSKEMLSRIERLVR